MARMGRPEVERVTVPCTACGAMLVRRASDYARAKTGRIFCDSKCMKRVGAKPRKGTNKICPICTTEFYSPPGAATSKDVCSVPCANAWMRRHRIQKNCDHCGAEFEARRSAPDQRFCKAKCRDAARFLRPTGEIHNGKPKVMDIHGYIKIWEPGHPNSYGDGWVAEHRFVASATIGRPIWPDEHVHHINGIKNDNRPENLAVLGHSAHSKITMDELWGSVAAMQQELAEYRRRFGPLTEESA